MVPDSAHNLLRLCVPVVPLCALVSQGHRSLFTSCTKTQGKAERARQSTFWIAFQALEISLLSNISVHQISSAQHSPSQSSPLDTFAIHSRQHQLNSRFSHNSFNHSHHSPWRDTCQHCLAQTSRHSQRISQAPTEWRNARGTGPLAAAC